MYENPLLICTSDCEIKDSHFNFLQFKSFFLNSNSLGENQHKTL